MTAPTVIVTGATGGLGVEVVERLLDGGLEVIAYAGPHGPVGPGSHRIDLGVEALPDPPSPDAVIVHLAGRIPHQRGVEDSGVLGTETRAVDWSVFETARRSGARVVYTSTCGLYQPSPQVLPESAPLRARTPYFEAKLAGERLFASLPGSTVLRLSSPVGPSTATVLRRFVDAALTSGELELWGSGEREQDFIDVRDVADAVERAVRHGVPGTFNIVSGAHTTMRELAEAVVTTVGAGTIVARGLADPQDGRPARYDASSARAKLAWVPKRSLPDMIGRLVASTHGVS